MKQLMNFTLLVLLAILILVGANQVLLSSGQIQDRGVVNFYNWGDYIDPDLLAAFEEETGYTVIYETFDSNEAMLTKVQQGGTNYDILGPSEYMVEVMADQGLLQPLDHSLLPNLSTLNPRFLDLSFDRGNQYSVPYFWGTLGIVYNHEVLGEGAIQEWEDLWSEAYRGQILMYDGAREVIGIGLHRLGYSPNETDSQRIAESAQVMSDLMPNILAIVADEMKMYFLNGEAPIGVTFSGEAFMVLDEDEAFSYVVPSKGSNLWLDNLVIPKDSQNPEGAHALINFLMEPENAAQNAEYIGYATPSLAALDLIGPEITSDPTFYPDEETLSHLEVFRDLGQETLIEYNDLFLQVKIEPRS